jgi:hypothetical protein
MAYRLKMALIEREWRQFGCLSLRGRKRTKTIYSQFISSRTLYEAARLGQRKDIRRIPALDTNSRLGPVSTEPSTPQSVRWTALQLAAWSDVVCSSP